MSFRIVSRKRNWGGGGVTDSQNARAEMDNLSVGFPHNGRDSHQQDAYAAAEWLRHADLNGNLQRFFFPNLAAQERKAAEIEGWILGIA